MATHIPMLSQVLPVLLTSLSLLSIGGCKQDSGTRADTDSVADVVSVSLSYPYDLDAAVAKTTVTVQALGDATCSKEDASGSRWNGQFPALNSTIPDLLARPGVLRDLATPCSLHRTDSGPYLSTRFVNDPTRHDRLVDAACTNDNLDALVRAMERIGDACIAAAQVIIGDGGIAE
jgi:hypothetical protein